jgi:hypothetical protein
MVAVTRAARAVPAEPPVRRAWSAGKLLDLVLAALANAAVLGAWALMAAAVMGTLAIPRRMVMNSEWVFDTGRLPQPWAIGVGIVAVVVAHLFFRWAMRRYSGGRPTYSASALAWLGILAGVAYGAYLWQPPVAIGKKVGPASGQSTPWTLVGYVAYYARLALPAVVAAITALVWLVGRRSPLRAFASGRRKARAARVPRRARVATS